MQPGPEKQQSYIKKRVYSGYLVIKRSFFSASFFAPRTKGGTIQSLQLFLPQLIQMGLFLLSAEIQNRDTRTTSTHQGWPFSIVIIVVETRSFFSVGWPHDFK